MDLLVPGIRAPHLAQIIPDQPGDVLIAAAVWLVVGGAVTFLVDRLLLARGRRSEENVADVVARALRWPLFLALLLGVAFILVEGLHPFPDEWQTVASAVLLVGFAVLVAHGIARVILALYRRHASRRPDFRALSGLLGFLTRLGIYSVALLIVLDHFGVAITPLLGAFGIGALAVALALQDTLANFFAGLYLTLDRPLQPGDYLEIDGGTFGTIRGYVLEVGWRSVRMRELPDNVFVVPNTRLAAGIIKNYDRPQPPMSVVLQCSVAYDSDLEHVERVVVDVGRDVQRTTTGAVREHDPFIRYHTFGDNGIGFSIILRVQTFVDQYLVAHEFFKQLHARFRDEGIVIPFPQRTLHLPERVRVEAPAPRGGDGGRAGAVTHRAP